MRKRDVIGVSLTSSWPSLRNPHVPGVSWRPQPARAATRRPGRTSDGRTPSRGINRLAGRAGPRSALAGGDHAGAAAAAEEAERPADEDQQPVLETDQIEEVDEEPGQPGREAAE